MKIFSISLGLILGMLLQEALLFAQPCLRAKPTPHCRSFFITEFGYGFKATAPLRQRFYNVYDDSTWFHENVVTGRHLLSSELGVMYNLNPNYSLGFTHFTGWDIGHDLHGGFKLRVRKWLSDKASFDLSGGALLWDTGNEAFQHPAFIGGASLNFDHYQSLHLTIMALQTRPYDYSYPLDYNGGRYRNFSPQQSEIGVFLGYKLSSQPGLVLHAAALTGFAIVLGAFLAAGPYD